MSRLYDEFPDYPPNLKFKSAEDEAIYWEWFDAELDNPPYLWSMIFDTEAGENDDILPRATLNNRIGAGLMGSKSKCGGCFHRTPRSELRAYTSRTETQSWWLPCARATCQDPIVTISYKTQTNHNTGSYEEHSNPNHSRTYDRSETCNTTLTQTGFAYCEGDVRDDWDPTYSGSGSYTSTVKRDTKYVTKHTKTTAVYAPKGTVVNGETSNGALWHRTVEYTRTIVSTGEVTKHTITHDLISQPQVGGVGVSTTTDTDTVRSVRVVGSYDDGKGYTRVGDKTSKTTWSDPIRPSDYPIGSGRTTTTTNDPPRAEPHTSLMSSANTEVGYEDTYHAADNGYSLQLYQLYTEIPCVMKGRGNLFQPSTNYTVEYFEVLRSTVRRPDGSVRHNVITEVAVQSVTITTTGAEKARDPDYDPQTHDRLKDDQWEPAWASPPKESKLKCTIRGDGIHYEIKSVQNFTGASKLQYPLSQDLQAWLDDPNNEVSEG